MLDNNSRSIGDERLCVRQEGIGYKTRLELTTERSAS
ncbi:hypothetical protein THAOC_29658, partial [Thalassiosira oceanica]